jgi:hypothetical protein
VAYYTPRKGNRLVEERERKRKAARKGRPGKRQKGAIGAAVATKASASSHLIIKGKDNKDYSKLVLMYNTIQSYVLAIKELWSYQTSRGLYNIL